MNGLLIVLVVLAFVAVVGVVGYVSAKKRREAMYAQAAAMGFAYQRSDPGLMARMTGYGDPFTRGFGRSASNVLTGTWDGRPAVAFDYQYKTRGGKNNNVRRHNMGIACVHSRLAMPELTITPEGPLTRAMGKLLGDDITLESEDFNRAFRMTSTDRRFASDLVDPRMMDFLLAHGQEGIRLSGGQAMRMVNGRLQPDQIPAAMAYLDAFLDRIPQHVRRTLGERPIRQDGV